jgi:hypothetical protein
LNTVSTSFILDVLQLPNLSSELLMTDRSLRLLLDFDACAQRDIGQASVFLHRRDRKFALTCEEQGVKPTPKRWMAYINRFNDSDSGSMQSAQTLVFWQRINSGFVAAGALFGLLTMIGLLFYDGGQRINITVIVAFVGFQLLLALFTTIQSIAGWQPWRPLLARFQKKSQSEILSKLQPVLMARAAHLGGVCFALSGLLTLLVMVLLQDLAFGWSTTLETDASNYHDIIAALAAPWAWLCPAAAPELALVEATRFFRASAGEAFIDPARWGQWWPFIAMLWATWALLPRGLLYILAGLLIKRKARRLLAKHPTMPALMYRMETPTLDTGNEHNDASDLPDLKKQLALTPLPNASILLSWAGAGDSQLPAILTQDKSMLAKTGGKITLAQDQKTLEQVATQLAPESNRCVLLTTRSWEPPTGELEDFITKAQELWPKGSHIVLVPLSTSIEREPDMHHVQQWLRFAARSKAEFVMVSLITLDNDSPSSQTGPIT